MAVAWTEKYRPKNLREVIGNENHIATMVGWLKEFKRNSKETKKILLICGPPGVGKTTIAHLLLKDHGYRVLEYNASDNRKGKTLAEILKKSVGRLNVMDMMYGRPQSTSLILDEIDGLKGNDSDRGGLGELIKFVMSKQGKSVHTPIICTFNSFSSKSLKKLKKLGVFVKLKRPGKYHCRQLMERIIKGENLSLDEGGGIQILKGLTGDMRQIINALWFLNLRKESGVPFNEQEVKKFLEMTMNKDKKPQLFDSVTRVLRDKTLTVGDCIRMNSIDIQIPLLLHENYPQIINTADNKNKFELHSKIMSGIVLHDIIQNQIFKHHNWYLSPYCAMVNLFNMNRLLSCRKMGRQVKINSADSLNKIQQSKTNVKAMNTIRSTLQLPLSDENLTHLAELLCGLLFDRATKKEMPGVVLLDRLVELLKNYRIVVDDINNIIRLNRYNSDNYTFGGKYKRHVIIHILRRRLETETILNSSKEDACTKGQIEGLLKTMCPYFTGKSDIKLRFKKIVKAIKAFGIDDENKIKHLLRDELIRKHT